MITIDQELREKALEFALRSAPAGHVSTVLDVAHKYYEFLSGETDNKEKK